MVAFRLAEALHASGDLAAASRDARAALQAPFDELARSFCHECIAHADAAEGNHHKVVRHFILSALESNVNSASWEKLRRLVARVAPDQAAWLEFQSLGVPEPMRRKYALKIHR